MDFFGKIFNIRNIYRKGVLIIADLFIIYYSIKISLYDSFQGLAVRDILIKYHFLILTLILIVIYIYTGQYRAITRYIGSKAVYINAIRNFLIIIPLTIYFYIFLKIKVPISNIFLLWFLISLTTSIYRFLLRDTIFYIKERVSIDSKYIAIYGAGSAGIGTLQALKATGNYYLTR